MGLISYHILVVNTIQTSPLGAIFCGNFPAVLWYNFATVWRGGEVETLESAKLRCAGSIPAHASYIMSKEGFRAQAKEIVLKSAGWLGIIAVGYLGLVYIL